MNMNYQQINEQTLQEITQAILETVHPDRIILFGSAARGAMGPDSDIDLLVVEKEPFGPARSRHQEINRIRRALSRFRIPKDILVYSASEYTQWQHSVNHVIARCVREGKVLYGRV